MSVRTVPGALDILNQKLGGNAGDIPASSTKEYALEKIYRTLGGEESLEGVNTTSEIIEKIADVAQGGGGSSDFSTADCALNITRGSSSDHTTIEGIHLKDDGPTSDAFNAIAGGEESYIAIMYKGDCNISISSTAVVTASGDIDLTDDGYEDGIYYYVATIHGDCSINCIGTSLG